jgi:hypothetical protein
MRVKKLLFFLPVLACLYGCPYEANMPMASKPAEAVDTSLLGYWYGIVKDGSDFFGIEALDIRKHSDSVYDIIRYGKAVKGDMILPDTAHFIGYTSYIGSQRFMNIESSVVTVTPHSKKSPTVTTQKVFYASALDRSNDTLEVKTITETFTARKTFSSSDEFALMVKDLLGKKKNIFDDQYSLKYRKLRNN